MKTPSDKTPPMAPSIARLMGLGERSVQKSYYPQLRQKIAELEKSQKQYRLLAENISDVIWLLRPDLSIAYISPSIERTSGYTPRELKEKPFSVLLDPDHANAFSDLAQILSQSKDGDKAVKEAELKQANQDGSQTWIEVRLSCLAKEGEEDLQFLGVSRDITERKLARKEKEEMQMQLLQAQKMESIGTLAGGVAHDFNNLLTVINGYATLLMTGLPPEDPGQAKLAAIIHAGRRAEELTRQLLAFSRKQIYTPKEIEINATIKDMDKMLRRLIGEDIHVETVLGDGISPISADQTQLEQIFTNLVVNARDSLNAMTAPGFKKRLTIETGQARFTDAAAHKLALGGPGSYAYFSVSDNGMGMDAETRKRIFEPFFTTKSKYKGTGLGLAMIYGIIKQNHGAIRVYSEPGQGAMFKIYWPVSSGEVPRAPSEPAAQEDLSGDETILLVEDDPGVLNFAGHALLSMGYEILKAKDGKQALGLIKELIQRNHPLPRLVVTDLIMPRMNGTEFAQKALGLIPEMKVVYASGHTDNHIVHNGMLEEGINFLQKPYSQQELGRIIRQVLSG